jgi:signal peptidase I
MKMSAPVRLRVTATVLLLLASFVLMACGGTSKSSSTTTDASTGRERSAKTPASDPRDRRYEHAQRNFLACMRAQGVTDPQPGERSAETLETPQIKETFRKAILHCYPSFAAALPPATRGFLPQPIRRVKAFYEASRAHLVSYRVPSGSMEPTLEIGDYAFSKPLSGSPRIGQIVVVHPPEGAQQEDSGPKPHVVRVGGAACSAPVSTEDHGIKFLKRIVAGPGDQIYIRQGHVYRNGAREPDPYIKACGHSPECNFPVSIKIPPGHWFVMGDNRGESDDSRFWGPIPTSWIVSVVQSCSAIGHPCAGS